MSSGDDASVWLQHYRACDSAIKLLNSMSDRIAELRKAITDNTKETEMAMTKETAAKKRISKWETTKRGPQDATLRNVRAAHTRIDELERRLDKLAKKVKKLKHG